MVFHLEIDTAAAIACGFVRERCNNISFKLLVINFLSAFSLFAVQYLITSKVITLFFPPADYCR